MAEAEAVLARELRRVGTDQLPAHERGQARRDLGLLRPERLHGAAVEDLALDRAALEHPPLGRVELVEAGREQRLQRRRHLDLVSRLTGHRQHLADEQRVAAGRRGDPRAQLLRHSRPDQACRVLVAERLEPHRHRPRGAAVEQLRAGHAEQQDRGAAREQRDVLDQVEERLLAPLDVVEHDDERRLLLEQLPERPGDLLRRRPRLRLPQQRADRRRGGRIGRQRAELLHHLDDRPVGDPDPVREAAAADDPRLDRAERLRRQPRLAETRIADDRDQLTPPLRHAPAPRPRASSASSRSRPTNTVSCRRSTAARAPSSRNADTGSLLPFNDQRLDRLDIDRVTDQRARRLRDQHLARRGRLLQPGRHVQRVTGRQPLLASRSPPHPCSPRSAPRSRARRTPPASPPPPGTPATRRPRARTGTPNTAITASPMNFSTEPPCRSTIPLIRSKYRASSARSASGSVDSPSAVEPTTSQNSTDTTFRRSPDPPPSGSDHTPRRTSRRRCSRDRRSHRPSPQRH